MQKADFFPPMYLSQPTARGYDPNSWSGVPNKHQQLFGIFGRHGSRAYYQLLRMMLLIMAFYIGSIPRVGVPRLFKCAHEPIANQMRVTSGWESCLGFRLVSTAVGMSEGSQLSF